MQYNKLNKTTKQKRTESNYWKLTYQQQRHLIHYVLTTKPERKASPIPAGLGIN